MPGPHKPFRFRRCQASIIAFLVWVLQLQSPAVGQSDAPSIADEQTKKLTIVFSPVEIVPIRVSSAPAESPISQENPSRRDDIERKSLARIFAGGMIIDYNDPFPLQNETNEASDVLLGTTSFASGPAMNLARAPQLPASLPDSSKESNPQQSFAVGEAVNSDVLPESSALRQTGLLQGMIEDNMPIPVVVSDLRGDVSSVSTEMQEQAVGYKQIPSYTMPDGGLDVYLLAPTRFSRPLPNAP